MELKLITYLFVKVRCLSSKGSGLSINKCWSFNKSSHSANVGMCSEVKVVTKKINKNTIIY